MGSKSCISYLDINKLLLFLALCLGVSTALADSRVVNISGNVTINGQAMDRETRVSTGDEIKTGPNSTVQIIMSDRSVIDLKPNTTFKISKFNYNASKPESGSSAFSLVKGTFRYISGLIAKANYNNVSVSTGTATIGIRGSFDSFSFDGVNITVDTSIGQAVVTFTDRSTLIINSGETGIANVQTGETDVTPMVTPDPAVQAAKAIAENPGDKKAVATALAGLSDAEQGLALAILINNASELGVTDISEIVDALRSIVASNPDNAAAFVFIAVLLSPENSDAFVAAAIDAAPEEEEAILAAVEEALGVAAAAGAGAGAGGDSSAN